MNLQLLVIDGLLLEQIGWALLNSLWLITLIGMIYGLMILVLRKSSSKLRYSVGCFALLVMLMTPLASFCLSDAKTYELAALVNSPASDVEFPAVDVESTPSVSDSLRQAPLDASVVMTDALSLLEQVPWIAEAWLILDDIQNKYSWLTIGSLSMGWFVGVILFSVRPLWGLVVVRRLRTVAHSPLPAHVVQLARDVAIRYGNGNAVQFVQSAIIEVPTIVGYFKPLVLLPASALTNLTAEQLELILMHELAHIRRNDYLMNVIQTFIETLLFYHPVVWWVSNQIRNERENCCDDVVVHACGKGEIYARALWALEEDRVTSVNPALAATGGALLPRIRRLVGKANPAKRRREQRTVWLSGVSAVALVACLITFNTTFAQSETEARKQESSNKIGNPEALAGSDNASDVNVPDNPEKTLPASPVVEQKPSSEKSSPPNLVPKPSETGKSDSTADSKSNDSFRVDLLAIDSQSWQAAIKKVKQNWDGQPITLLRVMLEDDATRDKIDSQIEMKSTKLNGLGTFPQGGGSFRVIKSGEFVIVEHINSTSRQAGKDPVWIGSFSHHHAKLRIPVPPSGEIGILGDVVLSQTKEESLGQVIIKVKHDPQQFVELKSCKIGSVVVGGYYGQASKFNDDGVCLINGLSPGSYKMLLPDFDIRKSRWDFAVKPGIMTQLTFTAHSQKEVELSSVSYGRMEPSLNIETDNLQMIFPLPSDDDLKMQSTVIKQAKSKQVVLPEVSDLKPIDRPNDQGFSQLHLAALQGDVSKAKLLLDQGANIDVQQRAFFGTPLQYAASGGHVEVARLLIEAKATVDAVDRSLRTPLMWAAWKGHSDVVEALLKSGADHKKTNLGTHWTALHFAADKAQLEAAQLLIDAGADLSPLDFNGETPHDIYSDIAPPE